MKNLTSKIVVAIGVVVSFVLGAISIFGTTEQLPDSTGKMIDVPVQMDLLLYWMYATIAIGVVLLLAFACKTLATMFQTDAKAAIKSIGAVVLFVLVMAGCYLASGETEFSRIVNGEVETYSETTMKMIDMWLYSFYVLIGATILLVIGFAAKRLIVK